VILYRPVGLAELRLVARSGFREFPPRLPGQPIIYPVLTIGYARQVARDWNARDEASGFAGFVLRFEIDDAFASRYEVRTVGGDTHRELWIPAEDLSELNRKIVGRIAVLEAHAGPRFAGSIDPGTSLPADLEIPPGEGDRPGGGPAGAADGGRVDSYLPPPGIRPDEEAVERELRNLQGLLEEARFESGWHAFSDEESFDIALRWRDKLEEAIEAWRRLLPDR